MPPLAAFFTLFFVIQNIVSAPADFVGSNSIGLAAGAAQLSMLVIMVCICYCQLTSAPIRSPLSPIPLNAAVPTFIITMVIKGRFVRWSPLHSRKARQACSSGDSCPQPTLQPSLQAQPLSGHVAMGCVTIVPRFRGHSRQEQHLRQAGSSLSSHHCCCSGSNSSSSIRGCNLELDEACAFEQLFDQ